ncbi:MAG: hypothetical protein CMO81_10925 [Waddliaceae bacterium]|nr:hypothetical protein [Waddliaceae bacterium]
METLEAPSSYLTEESLPEPDLNSAEKQADKASSVAPPKKTKASKTYVKIQCPSQNCQQELVLHCPYCHKGALKSKHHTKMLSCDNCKKALKGITCSCGFGLTGTYIYNKQHEMERLQDLADPKAYLFVGIVFSALGILIALANAMT